MFNKLRETIKGVVNKMLRRNNLTEASLAETAITDEMAAAIEHWSNLYHGRAPWLSQNALSLGLPASIAREMATLVTLEVKITVGSKGDADGERIGPRAQFIKDSLQPVVDQLAVQTEYACAIGGVAFRPYVADDQVSIDCIIGDDFYPTAFNAQGEITGALFVERKHEGKETFIRVEEHAMQDNGQYVITNRAFKSLGNNTNVGTPCSLTDVDEWRDIQPEVTINNVTEPLFSYFRIPQGNIIDTDSQLGVSVFARADKAGLLEEADKQFQRLAWEYEAGEMAIDASIDSFDRNADGTPKLPVGKERLFRVNDTDKDVNEGRFTTFAPALRDNNYVEGLNRILMRIEDICGLARGTYSDANDTVRTATELKISKQRTYATVTSIQMSLQTALDKLASAVNTLATIYKLAPEGDYEISYAWDDSIVVDADAEREKDRQDVYDNIMQVWEYRIKWYGETEAQAKAALEGMETPVEKALNKTKTEPEAEEE